ncbi:hypothetical protein [uncultured Fusobacterium sp.]|uniref:hypothetical protein n=1 Tax=uncultured Fusobacterium sp. TaxID=159267 RepID=UPI0025F107A8|nr:hypothetical protein [uncultured Fusobacterium sp.]
MKKLLTLLFLLITTLTLSKEKSISEIKTLEFLTKEEIILNKENRKTEYNIKFQVPDKIKKEIVVPELNKGEIYIYNKDEKTVYLPLFDQITYEKVNADENRIIQVINYIFQQEKENEDFRKKYYNSKIGELILEDGIKIKFEKFSKVDGYLLPVSFKIYDKDIKIGDIKIEGYKINPNFSKEEFILNNETI